MLGYSPVSMLVIVRSDTGVMVARAEVRTFVTCCVSPKSACGFMVGNAHVIACTLAVTVTEKLLLAASENTGSCSIQRLSSELLIGVGVQL